MDDDSKAKWMDMNRTSNVRLHTNRSSCLRQSDSGQAHITLRAGNEQCSDVKAVFEKEARLAELVHPMC